MPDISVEETKQTEVKQNKTSPEKKIHSETLTRKITFVSEINVFFYHYTSTF